MTFTPTQEQIEIVAAAKTGNDVIVHALAGSGKSSSLYLVSSEIPDKRILYIAFNKAIVEEATKKMPDNVECRTVHSIAYRNSGQDVLKKLSRPKPDNKILSSELSLKGFNVFDKKHKESLWLSPFRIIGWINKTVQYYMQSSDENFKRHHIYIDPDYEDLVNDSIKDCVYKSAIKLWERYLDPNDKLGISHDVYLKLFSLSGIDLGYDVIMLDESQDTSPVMLAILKSQVSSQKIYVGDKYQKIYSFTGSIDISTKVDAETKYLTKSFRFGENIANEANTVLDKLGNTHELIGTDAKGTIDQYLQPDAIICRTNSGVLSQYIKAKLEYPDLKINISCDTFNILHFAECLVELDEVGKTRHKYLNDFKSKEEFYEWTKTTDEDLDLELLQLASICKNINPEEIIETLKEYSQCAKPNLTIITAHKSKGLEWDTVELSDDFPNPYHNKNPEELRLYYVSITRAKTNLSGLQRYKDMKPPKPDKKY